MIKVGVVGCGYWGPNLIRNFNNNPECELVRVSDLRPGRLDFIKEQYPSVDITTDYKAIINDPSINAVVIATPVNTHKPIAMEALQAGKNVLVEKPLTDNYADAIELAEYAKSKGLIAAVGHIFQFAPAVTALKNYLNEGLIGEPAHFTSTRINLGPPKTTVDVVWDLGPHDLSILLYLFNETPIAVDAFGESHWWEGIVDNAHIFLRFKGNRSAHIHLSWLSSNKTRNTVVYGEKGNIVYNETLPDEEKLTFYDKGVDNRINAKDTDKAALAYGLGEVRKLPLVKGEPLALEVAAFINAVKTGIPPVNDAFIGAEVINILEQATKSMKEKM